MKNKIIDNDSKLSPSLICTIFTFSSIDPKFSKFILSDFLFEDATFKSLSYLDSVVYFELVTLLNKQGFRKFSQSLISPLVRKNNTQILQSQTKKLEEYLYKFKYNYRKYFLEGVTNDYTLPLDKELNNIAITALFLIAGA